MVGRYGKGGTMMNARRVSGLVLSCLSASAGGVALAQDWPQWRGPNRDAKAAAFNAPKTWPKELTRKWKVNVGLGDATPALVGDRLFVFTRQEANEVISALDAASGKEVWQDKYEAQGATGPSSGHAGPRCSPTVADGKVLTLGVRGTLSCTEAASGKKLWRKDDFSGAAPDFFTASSPLVVDGLTIAPLGGRENGAIVAYDLTTGDQKWKWASGSPGYASPVLMTAGGTKLIIAETDRKIVTVGAADGKPVWEAPYAPEGRGYNASTPLVDGQTVIFSGSGRGVKAMKLEKQGDGFGPKELWLNQENSVQFNTPVLKDGLIYGLDGGNRFFCIKAQDGKTAWTGPAGQPEEEKKEKGGGDGRRGRGGRGGRGGYGSIVDAGAVLMALTPSSELVVFQPSDKEYVELAKIKVADTPTYAHLVVSGNRLFVKDQDSLALFTIE
jgi:outer membrane protein assembly factor BamB